MQSWVIWLRYKIKYVYQILREKLYLCIVIEFCFMITWGTYTEQVVYFKPKQEINIH